jgi:hypothetical protein
MNEGKRSVPSLRTRPGACQAARDALQPRLDRDDESVQSSAVGGTLAGDESMGRTWIARAPRPSGSRSSV